MKVLWIVQGVMKEVAKAIGEQEPVSGTWIESLKDSLKSNETVELHILCVTTRKDQTKLERMMCDGVTYYLLPIRKKALVNGYDSKTALSIYDFISWLMPDIIHVHGTEFSISLNIDQHREEEVPICHSIQGLVSSIAENYFYADLPLNRMSPLESVPIRLQRRQYLKRGKFEREIIQRYRYFFGRTEWDFSHLTALNPCVKYTKVRELFRKEFVNSEPWQIDKIQRHTIFYAGGARVPLKGFHKFLDALSLIKRSYPDVVVYVSGIVPNKRIPLLGKIGYGKYLDKCIKARGLSENVVFTGPLSAERMLECFRSSHCYVLGSSIENSSNTLVEAMLVGTPSVVASVGGIKDFVTHGETAYIYRFEEVEMLAYYVKKLFEDDTLANDFSTKSRKTIREQLDGNQKDLLHAYEYVIRDFKEAQNV